MKPKRLPSQVRWGIWLFIWVGMVVAGIGCQNPPSPPTPTPFALSDTPQPTSSPQQFDPKETVAFVPLSMTLSANSRPLEVTINLLVDEACEPPSAIAPTWAGSVVTPNVDISCSQPLSGRQRDITVTFPLDSEERSPGFYVIEFGSLRQPFTIEDGTSPGDAAAREAPSPVSGSGRIDGRVWHDACQNDAVDPQFFDGCIRLGNASDLVANGRFDDGEEGIPQVWVTLYQGTCEGIVWEQAVSDHEGQFSFGGLPPGEYCAEVDALSRLNKPVLQPGVWRQPAEDEQQAQRPITLTGQSDGSILFGWDYARLPRRSTTVICQNKGWVIDEEALSPGPEVVSGRSVTVGWRVENIGTCPWTTGYRLAPLDANGVVDHDAAVFLDVIVPPGERIDLTVDVDVPEQLGRWRPRWVLLDDKNNPFGIGLAQEQPLAVDLTVISP